MTTTTETTATRVECIRDALLEFGWREDGQLFVCLGKPYCDQGDTEDIDDDCPWCHQINTQDNLTAEQIEANIVKQTNGH